MGLASRFVSRATKAQSNRGAAIQTSRAASAGREPVHELLFPLNSVGLIKQEKEAGTVRRTK